MDRRQLSEWRSEVIGSFIAIEQLLNCIISQHYFNAIDRAFFLEVLFDEYFGFQMRRRILEKILPQDQRDVLQPLNRMATIRNYFGHCGLEVIEGGLPRPEETGAILDPRHPAKPIDFASLFTEFKTLEERVVRPLTEFFVSKGGTCVLDGEGPVLKVRMK